MTLKNSTHAYSECIHTQAYEDIYICSIVTVLQNIFETVKKHIKSNTPLMSPLTNIYY